jgi:hypothetical protein
MGYFFPIFLIHFVQALTRLPLTKITHCKFGCFLFFEVGLYLLRNFFRVIVFIDVFPQRKQIRDIIILNVA